MDRDFFLNSKQELALTIKAKRLLLSGAIRSGKSTLGCIKVREIATRMPGSQIMILKSTLKEIRDDTWKILYNPTDGLLANSRIYGKLNKSNYEHYLPNGSKIIYRQGSELGDEKKLLGLDLSCIYFSQAENISKYMFDYALGRLTHWGDNLDPRSRGYAYIKKYGTGAYASSIVKRPGHFFIMDANPDTGSWIYDDIIRKCPESIDPVKFAETPHIRFEYAKEERSGHPQYWDIINFKTRDNAQLPKIDEWIAEQKAMTSDTYYHRMIEGEWVGSEGMIYNHFDNIKHIAPNISESEFNYNKSRYEIVVAIDPGSSWYTGVVFMAYDKKNQNYIIFDEIKIKNTIISEIAEIIKEKLIAEKIDINDVRMLIDPAANAPESNGMSKSDQYRQAKIYVSNANKTMSLERINGLFKQNRIFIMGNCVNLLIEIKSYSYDKDGKPNKKSGANAFDNCIAGNTLIEMNKGFKQIKDIKINDVIKTSTGFKKVLDWKLTNSKAKVIKFFTSSGKTLIATPDHKIYTPNGKVSIDTLRYFDIIEVSNTEGKKSWLNIQYTKIKNIKEILKRDLNILEMQILSCIGKYGKISMVKLKKDMRSTILILIQAIMNYQILNVLQGKNIDLNIEEDVQINKEKFLKESDHLHLFGMEVKRVWSGIFNTVKMCLGILFPKLMYAIYVVKNINQNKHGVNSVQTIVNQQIEENKEKTIKQGNVSFVHKILLLINILNQNHAPEYAVGKIELEEPISVYDLTVEDDHQYYANGILISNCDAFRYCLNNYAYGLDITPPTPTEILKSSEGTQAQKAVTYLLNKELYERNNKHTGFGI